MIDDQECSGENSLTRIFMQCRDALVRSILKMSVKPEDVDDILQETYLRVHAASQKKTIQSPKDYLFVVSRNLVLRGLTHRSRELQAVIDDAVHEASDSSLDAELHQQQKLQTLNEALEVLPDKSRQAILLRKVYGFSSVEIAKKMGVSKSSVDKYIASGISQCEALLNARGYDVGGGVGQQPPREGGKTEQSKD